MAEKATALDNITKLAVMAVGGQGGGVLTNWIVDLAEANGYVYDENAPHQQSLSAV